MVRRHFLRLLLAGATIGATGCFGSFKATMWALDLNRSVSRSKFVRWLVFLVMIVIPVYEVAILIDVWVLNSIEFWFGGPATAEGDEDERTVALDDGTALYMRKDRAAGLLYTSLLRANEEPIDLVFEIGEDGARVRGRHGIIAGVRSSREGGVEVWAGDTVEHVPREQVEELDHRFEQDGAAGAAAWAVANQPPSAEAA